VVTEGKMCLVSVLCCPESIGESGSSRGSSDRKMLDGYWVFAVRDSGRGKGRRGMECLSVSLFLICCISLRHAADRQHRSQAGV